MSTTNPLRIALLAPPSETIPPTGYGGTERIIAELANGLVARGHHVTTFCSGDSTVPGAHVVTAPAALRPAGLSGSEAWRVATATMAIDRARSGELDIIHGHLELTNLLLGPASPIPVVATFHGRLDDPAIGVAMRGNPCHFAAISEHQASTRPEASWAGVIHNGLTLDGAPFERRRDDALVFVGRVAPEKGIIDALDVARLAGRPLRIIAKVGTNPRELAYHREVFEPALEAAGSDVEFMGELNGDERDLVVATSYATIMPSAWPEPFGLVAIESMACGTPVLTRRVGALPEIIRDGVDGFFGDDVEHLANLVGRIDELDREAIRASALDRFNADRMTDAYEALMMQLVTGERPAARLRLRVATSGGDGSAAAAPARMQPAPEQRVGDASGWRLPVEGSTAR